MEKFRWETPHSWLAWKYKANALLHFVGSIVDCDDIQTYFQLAMKNDGYFEPIEKSLDILHPGDCVVIDKTVFHVECILLDGEITNLAPEIWPCGEMQFLEGYADEWAADTVDKEIE